jgi:hypothetical protein
MNRYFFATLLLVALHYSLSGILLPEPPSHWLAPLTNDVRSILTVLFGKLPFDEHALSLLLSAIAVGALGLGLLGLFGWVVPAAWYLPSLVTGAGASVLLYLLFFNQWAFIPLLLNGVILYAVIQLRAFAPTVNS